MGNYRNALCVVSRDKLIPTKTGHEIRCGEVDKDQLVVIIANSLYRTMKVVSAGDLARDVYMSERTLRRRLKGAGISYRELITEARLKLAKQYLQDKHLNVGQISLKLGYQSPASFTHAFKRWTGISPREYGRAGIYSSIG
jgi:AraC-like DNA-binding protein